jgi:hypothetical protein
MSVGWGGKQPRMKETWYIDIAGKRRKQSMIFTGQQTEILVSSFSGRKPKGAPEPSHVGEPKGLHQVLWERGLVPALLTPSSKVNPTSRHGKILGFLEAEGRMDAITQNPNKWNDE